MSEIPENFEKSGLPIPKQNEGIGKPARIAEPEILEYPGLGNRSINRVSSEIKSLSFCEF